eukprot:COSAG02_NODE_2495_length_8684_cov_12.735469_5_plen_71_part_00
MNTDAAMGTLLAPTYHDCIAEWDDWAPLMWNWPPRAFPDGAKHWLGNDPHLPERPFPLSLYNVRRQSLPP